MRPMNTRRLRPTWLCALALSACSPTVPEPLEVSPPATLGEVAYGISATMVLEGQTCPTERYDALAARRSALIGAIDHVAGETSGAVPALGYDLMQPLVVNGTMQESTDWMAEVLARLVDDDIDPNRDVLRTLLELPALGIEPRHLIAAANGLASHDDIDRALQGLVDIAQDSDGVTTNLDTLLGLVSRLADDIRSVPPCTDAETTLLAEQLLLSSGDVLSDARPRAYAALKDHRGIPRVRVEAGQPVAPFVDADRDGLIDLDDAGRPLDQSGEIISLRPFVGEGERDDHGRPLTADGGLVFEYVDVEQTPIGLVADLAHDAMVHQIPRHATSAIADMLGDPEPCGFPPDCQRFPADSPVADLAFLMLRMMEEPSTRAALQRASASSCSNGDDILDRVDQALLAAGRLVALTEPTADIDVEIEDLLDFVDDLLPTMEAIFAVDALRPRSAASRMLDGLDRLEPSMIEAFAHGMEYVDIDSPGECDGLPPNPASSVKVDFSRGPNTPFADANASAAERVVKVIQDVDRCYPNAPVRAAASAFLGVPWPEGESMANFIFTWMGSSDAANVCSLASTTDSLTTILGPGLSVAGGCPDFVVAEDLEVIDDIANSGALDIYGVLASELKDHPGGVDLIVAIFSALADNARLGDASVFRKLQPMVIGAVQTPTSPQDPTGLLQAGLNAGRALSECDRNTLDAIVDLGTAMFEERTITRRDGSSTLSTSWARELLPVMRRMAAQAGSVQDADWEALSDWGSELLTATRSTPQGDRLEDPRMAPTVAALVQLAAGPPTLSTDRCYIGGLEPVALDFLTGENLPALVRLTTQWNASEAGASIEALVTDLLRPAPETPRAAALSLAAGLTQPTQAELDLDALLQFTSDAANPYAQDHQPLIETLAHLLATDRDGVFRQLLARATDQGETDDEMSALELLLSTSSDVASRTEDSQCLPSAIELDLQTAEDVVTGAVSFLEDDVSGLGAIYTWLRRRADALSED